MCFENYEDDILDGNGLIELTVLVITGYMLTAQMSV